MAIDSAGTGTGKNEHPARPHARLEKWMWIVIYIGITVAVLGFVTARTDAAVGWMLMVPGALAVIVGIVLIYVRSRLEDPKP
jgi:purine-cytosine permease-like protein